MRLVIFETCQNRGWSQIIVVLPALLVSVSGCNFVLPCCVLFYFVFCVVKIVIFSCVCLWRC